MPEVLELLKRKKEMKKADINTYMRAWIRATGFDDRDRSITWALNRLEKEKYVAHPRTGIWQIANKGLTSTLSPEEAMKIMQRWTEQERIARKTRPSKK